MRLKSLSIAAIGALMAVAVVVQPVMAAGVTVVTPTDTQGWSTADTRPGGDVNFVTDSTAPGNGALQLTTDSTTTSKAQYMHEADLDLSAVTELSYSSKTIAGPVHAAPSYQLAVDLNGDATGGFTTFVYEPYENGAPTVTKNTWINWDVDSGRFWSSRTVTDGTCDVVAGAGGAPFYTLTDLQANCPDAVVVEFGVNIGSNNPSYDVYTDLVSINGEAYDFEAQSYKDQCKNGGWETLNGGYKNQGQCVAAAVSGDNSRLNRE